VTSRKLKAVLVKKYGKDGEIPLHHRYKPADTINEFLAKSPEAAAFACARGPSPSARVSAVAQLATNSTSINELFERNGAKNAAQAHRG